jgi:hypothetical protein
VARRVMFEVLGPGAIASRVSNVQRAAGQEKSRSTDDFLAVRGLHNISDGLHEFGNGVVVLKYRPR